MTHTSYGKSYASRDRQLFLSPLCFQEFSVVKLIYSVVKLIYSVVKLIYLVVKLAYTGLVKYAMLPTQIMSAFVRLRLVEKLTRPTQNSMFVTHLPGHKRNAIQVLKLHQFYACEK